MNEDFLDFLAALVERRARFLVVGAHAMAVHGVPRATGDLDVWIDRSGGNAARVWEALLQFGAPVESLGVVELDLTTPGVVVQIGLPPRRIDLMTSITAIDFASAWEGSLVENVNGLAIRFLGREQLMENKRATGRLKDLADVEALEQQDG